MNDMNAALIDQQVLGIIEKNPEWFKSGDEDKKKSLAFLVLCMSTYLDISKEEAVELLTDGGNDVGIDGIYMTGVDDNEFAVTIFQGKYKRDLSGESNFPENELRKTISMLNILFDPRKDFHLNESIKPKIEDIRSLIRDGYIPNVQLVMCNNGKRWKDEAQAWIDESELPREQVQWIYFNHDSIVEIQKKTKAVNDSMRLIGKAIIEDFTYRRVLIGRAHVSEIALMFERHDNLLLQRNIRRYLGMQTNRVNSAIHKTLKGEEGRKNFYFFNNGVTMVCRKFVHNGLQNSDYVVKLEGLQIINGGQTCKTIQQTIKDSPNEKYEDACVMVRIYELEDDDQDFVRDVTYATNSQNPVDLRDLHSNDDMQKQLEIGMAELGYEYRSKRDDANFSSKTITSPVTAEAVLAVWREKPHQAKFRRTEHFGKLYEAIFNGLNAAQALLAVMIFRAVENERKRPKTQTPPEFLPYASHYISMFIGRSLIKKHAIRMNEISHKNFETLLNDFETNRESFIAEAIAGIDSALKTIYGDKKISLQQLSATFRGGVLLEELAE